MRHDRLSRRSALLAGITALIAGPTAGCGGGSSSQAVVVSPEAQKKTEDYLQRYQKKMFDQHKTRPGDKKPR